MKTYQYINTVYINNNNDNIIYPHHNHSARIYGVFTQSHLIAFLETPCGMHNGFFWRLAVYRWIYYLI